MKILFLSILIISFSAAIFGQKPDLSELSEMEGGRRILEYFKTFNSADEQKLKDFFLNNLTADSLKQRPVEPRLEFHRTLREDFQTFEIKDVMSVEIRDFVEVVLLVQGKTGNWANYSFRFEKSAPQKLLGWQIEQTDAPNQTKYEPPKNTSEFLLTVEKYLNDRVAKEKFSGVVLVAKEDKPIFQKAYGIANKETNTPNNLNTKFNLGSINKTFTRVAIGQLVQQGKISFDDKLGKYLSDYPNKEAMEKVTIRHLITMKSGIGDFFGEKFMKTPKEIFVKTLISSPFLLINLWLLNPAQKNNIPMAAIFYWVR